MRCSRIVPVSRNAASASRAPVALAKVAPGRIARPCELAHLARVAALRAEQLRRVNVRDPDALTAAQPHAVPVMHVGNADRRGGEREDS